MVRRFLLVCMLIVPGLMQAQNPNNSLKPFVLKFDNDLMALVNNTHCSNDAYNRRLQEIYFYAKVIGSCSTQLADIKQFQVIYNAIETIWQNNNVPNPYAHLLEE